MGAACCKASRKDDTQLRLTLSKYKYKDIVFEDVNGDIHEENVEAIMNPINHEISYYKTSTHSKGSGNKSQNPEQDPDDNLKSGTVIVTPAPNSEAKYMINVVTPVWMGDNDEEKLARTLMEALAKADELGVHSIAIPNLFEEIFGFPRANSAKVLVEKTLEYVEQNYSHTSMRLIKFMSNDHFATETLNRKFNKNTLVERVNDSEDKDGDCEIQTRGYKSTETSDAQAEI